MLTPNASFGEIASTTYKVYKPTFADNVTNKNALLMQMNKKGRKRFEPGGESIVCPIDYAENSTYTRYSGYGNLNVQASEVLSAAEYQWKQASVVITCSGLEWRKNMGSKTRIINLVKARMKNALNTMANNFSSDLYSDGTASNQINGLQALIADSGTGTVGGINSSAFGFWQNTVQSAASPLQGGGAITPSATTIESLMLPLYLELVRGQDKPDLIMASNDYFTFFEQSQTNIKRYTDASKADAGFVTMDYKGIPVIFDGGSGISSEHMYFINTNYLELVVHPDADMTEFDELRTGNQDAWAVPILFMGNLTCSNRALQGVLKA